MVEVSKKATRESYGEALVELGKKHKEVVVLDADLAEATKTIYFRNCFPERHIDCGIAETNMFGIAAGLSTVGKVPFASTFAMFSAGRAFEQIRNTIGYPHLNVKIGATHAGITVGEDGASHQCNEDIALMKSISGMTVICPSDDVETKAAVKAAYEIDGPVYLRMGRYATPIINNNIDYEFSVGKARIMKKGKDLTLVVTGICVSAALEVADMLEKQGISAEVINVHTIKPLDEETIINSAKKTGIVFTAEEHSVIGGLGSEICSCVCANFPVKVVRIGINDVFGHSGSAEELIKEFGLDGEGIYKTIMENI